MIREVKPATDGSSRRHHHDGRGRRGPRLQRRRSDGRNRRRARATPPASPWTVIREYLSSRTPANNVIREVLPEARSTTIAGDGTAGYNGDGPATAAELKGPTGVALDGSGDLFIADTGNDVIREDTIHARWPLCGRYHHDGRGHGGRGPARAAPERTSAATVGQANDALLDSPSAVAVDSSGDIYIADTDNNAVREVISGQAVTVAQAP